jgi:hypothetical protein
VPLVQPTPVATADVEAVSVAPAQPKVDASSVGTPMPWEARAESSMSGPVESWMLCVARPKSWSPRRARQMLAKQAMKEPQRVGRFDYLGWRSDRQPLFRGWSYHLRPRSDR